MKAILNNLYKIFLEPQDVFNDIKTSFNKMHIIMPLLVLVILGIVTAVVLNDLFRDIQWDTIVERLEKQDIPDDIRAEQFEKIEQRIFEPTTGQIILGYVASAITNIIKVALMALIVLLIGNMVFGGTAKYGPVMAMTAYVYLINVLEMVVKIPLMLNKWSMDVYTGLGVLGIGEPGTFIHNVFAGIDLFALWRIILLSIGMAIIFEKKQKPFLIALLVFWIALIMVMSGVSAMFNG